MTIQFVIGRAGSGKTTFCLKQISKKLQEAPLGAPLIALVPEQATFQMEQQLLQASQLPGMIRAQALSFQRLAFRMMQEVGDVTLTPIDDVGKAMLLYKIMQQQAERLRLFVHARQQPGFIERLVELLTEWKRYGIDGETIREYIAIEREQQHGTDTSWLLEQKLYDLAIVFDQIELLLTGQFLDAEDYLIKLAEQASQSTVLQHAEVWVDGFHGFTPTEYNALEAIIQKAAMVTITLTLDEVYDDVNDLQQLQLFYPTAATYVELRNRAEQLGIEVLPTIHMHGEEQSTIRFQHNKPLAHLERYFGRGILPVSYEADDVKYAICLSEAVNRRAEVEAVARHMTTYVQEKQISWNNCAIMLRDSDAYLEHLEQVFTQYNIPYFIDQKEKATYHPLITFIKSALEVVIYGWQHEPLFRCIKTELLYSADEQLPRVWYDLLENYVLATGINGWKWHSEQMWRKVASLDNLDQAMYHEQSERISRYEMIMAARASVLTRLLPFGERMEKAKTVKEMCSAIFQFLDDCAITEQLQQMEEIDMLQGDMRSARNHEQLWNNIISILDQLVVLTGDEVVEPELLLGMIEAGLDSLQLASVPPQLDQVLIGSMERTRSANLRAIFILGANDGVMPMKQTEDGLISEVERDQLSHSGIVLAPSSLRRMLDERFIIYTTITAASDFVYLSWTIADDDGKAMLPSEIIRQIRKLFPQLSVHHIAADPGALVTVQEQHHYIVHPQAALTYLVSMLQQWLHGKPIDDVWWQLYNWYVVRPEWTSRLTMLLRSLSYRNEELPLSQETATRLYGENLFTSVSRMERFITCPFQHFSIYGLKLREREQFKLAAPDIGQLFHDSLSILVDSFGQRLGQVSKQQLEEAVDQIVEQAAGQMQSQILQSSSRYRYITKKLKKIIVETAAVLSEHARRSTFQPIATELDFGPDGQLPAFEIILSSGQTINIVGRIDRVDGAETEEGLLLRIMDYKSSATELQLHDVEFGLSLQLLTYLDVLMEHGERWLGKPVQPAGVLYCHVHHPILSLSGQSTPDAVQNLRMKHYKLRGLVSADVEVVKMMDNQLETGYSDLLPVAVKKDDSFYSTSSVVTKEQWQLLSKKVRQHIIQIGDAIQQGEIDIEPYRSGLKTACDYCSYRPVCQFDPLIDGNGYRRLDKQTDQLLWTKWEEE